MSSTLVHLSAEQRARLFNATGAPLRRLSVEPSTGIGVAVDRYCARCLLTEDLPGVHIEPDGICQACHAFAAEAARGDYTQRRLLDVVQAWRGEGTPDCVVAYSGGKDSALTLMLAVKELNLRPIAVLVDNGFIPDEVKDNARAFCARFDVQLIIETIDIRQVARESLSSASGRIPCSSCIGGVFAAMAKTCRTYGVRLILSGHRFPPMAYPVSGFTKRETDNGFLCASPLLARGLSEAEQMEWIRDAGWIPTHIAGNTSNCKLIGVVEQHLYDVQGFNPHIYEVSKEIRAGFYDRRKGFNKVDRPEITPEHLQWVRARLSPDAPDAQASARDDQGSGEAVVNARQRDVPANSK